ncbi:MAG: DM13 domain-containing protein [Cyanobacteria bacterium J06629_2]
MQRLSLTLIFTLVVGTTASHSVVAADKAQFAGQQREISSAVAAAATSQFVAVEHPTVGEVSIIEADGKKYLEIGQDFKSDRGSDLKVILHQAATVDFRVQEEEYSNLAALQASLQAFSDAQHYLIPDNVDLSNYQSVAILV